MRPAHKSLFCQWTFLTLCLIAVTPLISRPALNQDQEKDASKPTNFYPLLENNLEYNSRDTGGDLWGHRAQLIYPPSE